MGMLQRSSWGAGERHFHFTEQRFLAVTEGAWEIGKLISVCGFALDLFHRGLRGACGKSLFCRVFKMHGGQDQGSQVWEGDLDPRRRDL